MLSATAIIYHYHNQKPITMTPPEELAGCCLLIADRHATRRRQLGQMLRAAGAVVRTVSDLDNVVPEVIAAELMGRPWNVVLLRMETSQGAELEVGRRLRESGSMVPVIGMMEPDSETSTDADDLDSQCRVTGCCACVNSAAETPGLIEVITRLWHPEPQWRLHTSQHSTCQIRSCFRRQPDGLCEVH